MLDELLELILEDAQERMEKSLKDLQKKLRSLRAGRASPVMLHDVRVRAYGRTMLLNHLASVTAPQPDLIVVQPWDASTMSMVEKALRESSLGLNPSNDGTIIRVPIPPLTEERRKSLVKQARRLGEESKISIRNIRRHAKDDAKETQMEEKLSEDMRYLAESRLQEQTNAFVNKVDDILSIKERAIMEI